MPSGGLAVARLFGIEIRVSIAWAMVLGVVTLLAADRVDTLVPALPDGVNWLVGALAAAAFLGAMVAHELAHAVLARRSGIEPGPVVLGFIVGLAPLEIQGRTPRDEAAIATVGPIVSLVLAVVLLPAGVVLEALEGPGAAAGAALVVVGSLSGVVGLLSLLPGLPLDGGRVVRAVSWQRSADRRRASRTTAVVGRATGWVLAGLGIAIALLARPAEGLMVLSLGWFLTTGARTVVRRIAVEELLDGVPVRDALEREVVHVAPQLTLDTFADRFTGPEGLMSLPVVSEDRVVGVVSRDRLRRVARRLWSTTHAGEIMASPPDAPFLGAETPLWEALDALQRSGLEGLVVIDAGELAGVLTRRGVAALIQDRVRARAAGGGSDA
jgi:Zn-dependent protease/predicted transcriptional regulator